MQTKTGAFLSMGRIPQLIGTSAFALSALAGGVILAGGEAHAAAITCSPTSVTFNEPAFGIGTVTNSLLNGTVVSGGSNCQVDATGQLHPQNQTSVSLAYTPTNLTGTDTFTYTYTSDNPKAWFDQVQLSFADSNFGQFENVRKQVYGGGPTGPLLADLYTNNSTVLSNLSGQYTTLYVVDTIDGAGAQGGSISRVTNAFRQTPGPLPILGAGAAFGFSRKLRGRIKAARLG